jgi:putative transposase
MRYRRIRVGGASYFFTLVTYRRQSLFGDADVVDLFESARQSVQSRRAFTLEAQVILPDHLHAIWTLPDDDFDYATRWRLIKEAFTRAFAQSHRLLERGPRRRARGEQTVWQRRYWEPHPRRTRFRFPRGVHPLQPSATRSCFGASRLAAFHLLRVGRARGLRGKLGLR